MNDADGDDIRVLHVDDDADFGEMVGMQLRRQSEAISVVTESTVDDGLACLQTDDVDCVVSDHDMPDKDGLTFSERSARRIRSCRSSSSPERGAKR